MQPDLPLPCSTHPQHISANAAPCAHRAVVVGNGCIRSEGVELILRRLRVGVEIVETGQAALERITRATPCLLLVDLDSAAARGTELLRALEDPPLGAALSVVVVTRDVHAALARPPVTFGGLDVLKRPFDDAELLIRVASQIRLHEARQASLRLFSGSANATLQSYPCRANSCHGAENTRPALDFKPTSIETFLEPSERQRKDGLYRSIFEHSFDAILTIHADTCLFTSANPACVRLFGASSEAELLARPPEAYSPEFQPDGVPSRGAYLRNIELALGDGHATFDWTHLRVGGPTFEATVQFIRMRHDETMQIQVIVRDVSAQRHAARQLEVERQSRERTDLEVRTAQKLEAIGQLAAGIAHELNTPTQFASDNVHFLQEALLAQQSLVDQCRELKRRGLAGEPTDVLAKEFDLAESALDLDYLREQGPAAARSAIEGLTRIAGIVKAMKDFSHPDASEKTLADLNSALRNTLTIAKNEYKYVANIETRFADLPLVECYLGALNQVFLNLVVNAAHAISDRVGSSGSLGQITIRTFLEGNSVRIDVSDTGIGIPLSLQSRVFEPFFTTKEVGRGTGQGLAIARSIVCGRHGGTIGFESVEGTGTTFTVRIPAKGQVE